MNSSKLKVPHTITEMSLDEDPEYAAYITSQRFINRRQTVPATLKMSSHQGENKSIAESLKKIWKDYFSRKEQSKDHHTKSHSKQSDHDSNSPRTLNRRMKLRQSSATEEDILHFAISRDDIKSARQTIENGNVDINAMRPPGVSALHQASATGSLQCIQLLLDNGADVGLKTWQGQSALQVAARYGNFEAAELLLANGANMDDIKDGF